MLVLMYLHVPLVYNADPVVVLLGRDHRLWPGQVEPEGGSRGGHKEMLQATARETPRTPQGHPSHGACNIIILYRVKTDLIYPDQGPR